jgi:hypothetical protein
MCLQEFSVVLIVLGVHNILKTVGATKEMFCSWRSQSKFTSLNTSKLLAL